MIGGNEFYIVGPSSDPANIKKRRFSYCGLFKIADSRSLFFTRNDNSGTHKKEMVIWNMAKLKPEGSWYVATYDFMGPYTFKGR